MRDDGQPVLCEMRYASSPQDGSRFRPVVFQGIAEYLNQAELLQHRATHEAPTGPANRRGIEESLPEVTGETTVLLCDLGDSKRVNDASGHAAGGLDVPTHGSVRISIAGRRVTGGRKHRCPVVHSASPVETLPW